MDESPTDSGTDQSSSDSSTADESLLDTNQSPSADEHDQGTVSGGETQDTGQDSDTEPQDGTTQDADDSSDTDDGLERFAKSQGIEDVSSLTERERSLLKTAHDNQREARKRMQADSDELRKSVDKAAEVSDEEVENLDAEDAHDARVDAKLYKIEQTQRTLDFYAKNPEAREYDREMGEIVFEELENNGKEAARYLASDLNRLYVLAKARRGENDAEVAREAGRREERELLRKRQEGSADTGHAQNTHSGPTKIDRTWVENEYDSSNPEHRKLVDEAIARGDLY